MEVRLRRKHMTIWFPVILSTLFIVGVVFINQVREFNQDFSFSSATIVHQTDPPPSIPAPSFRLLIGVFTDPSKYLHRNFLRLVYGTQAPVFSQVDVKFVFCNLTSEEQQVLVAVEIMRFDDIIILNCPEKEDGGKAYSYLSNMPDMFDSPPGRRPAPYDYVMKVDDDTLVRIGGLEDSLRDMAREHMYYGFETPCQRMGQARATGTAYVLSWDLTEHVTVSSHDESHRMELQRSSAGDVWLQSEALRLAQNRYSGKAYMDDSNGACGDELGANTVAFHGLKDQGKWVRALTYFNMTSKLEPSKFYHIH
ncbi:unnamed protein product [Victoria cruziana]